jgi:hypothetical protein
MALWPYVKANKRLSSLQQTQLQSDALPAIQGDRGVCVNGQEQKSAAKKRLSHPKCIAQINLAHIVILHHLIWLAGCQNLAIVQNINPINQFKRFPNIMVGDQHTNSTRFQIRNQLPDFSNSDRINSGKRLIQKQIFWIGGQTASDFHASPFATR